MNDLHAWLLQQHHGLRTFYTFQQKLATLSGDEPGQRALCRLLSSLVGGYIEAHFGAMSWSHPGGPGDVVDGCGAFEMHCTVRMGTVFESSHVPMHICLG